MRLALPGRPENIVKAIAPDAARPTWTRFVRATHWAVAVCVIVNLCNDTGWEHRMIGYACLALVTARIVYACASRHASSRLWWPSCADIWTHQRHLRGRLPEDRAGHNPLGQIAVYAMWALISLLGLTGWISRTDMYWGEDGPVVLHAWLADALAGMVVLHVTAVIGMSWWLRRNLIKTMVVSDGSKVANDNNSH